MITIFDLLQMDGIEPVKATATEWHSKCPECGGRDRLSCWPDKANSSGKYLGGRFCCRGCGIHGDALTYLQRRRGLSFREACKALDVEPGALPPAGYQQHRAAWQPEAPAPAPDKQWQERARAFLSYTQRALASNQQALDWLRVERGLTAETVKAAKLGFNPADVFDNRAGWGLPEQINDKGRTKKQWLPAGLVIPLSLDDQLIRLRIRRQFADQYGRFIMISGSSKAAMTLWADQQSVAVFESELDGLLVHQDAGDFVGVVALGSAQQKPDSGLHGRFMAAERVLCCLDTDAAGGKAAWTHWTMYPKFKRWPTITGKDCTEQMKSGLPVRQWLMAAITPTGGAGPS